MCIRDRCWIRWYYDYPDPNNGYFDMFYSNKESGKRQAWSNTEFDDWTIKGKELAKPEDRLNAYKNCERCLLYTSPSPRDRTRSRMPSSA